MPRWISNPKHNALIWCACVVLALATLAALCVSGIRLESNILKLLPASEQDPVLNAAVENFADQSSRKVILLVGHTDRETARDAARHVAEQLSRSAQFSRVRARTQSNPERTFYELYFPARAGLLPPDLLDELES
ncbi:MAG: hypothetical protein OSB41_06135, partial [Kiritimatiellae bacterium]|nr:hypothetical protein [Kiritimatiellia bacterium]